MRFFRLYLPALVITLTFLGAVLVSPVAYQKVNAIHIVEDSEACHSPNEGKFLDVEQVISVIPFVERPGDVFSVSPEEKHRRTILEGNGNCSNLVFGLSYDLIRKGVDFEIIHLLPDGFLAGEGHTVIRVPMMLDGEQFIGILDILNAGVLVAAAGPVDLGELRLNDGLSVLSLNPCRPPQDEEYYDGRFLQDAVDGCIRGSEVESYFSFLNRFYVPLGSELIEKYVFDGLALVVGAYPRIRVTRQAFRTLFEDRMGTYYGYKSALWWFRFVIAFGTVALAFELQQIRGSARAKVHPHSVIPHH